MMSRYIDDITKYAVYGWIREAENALNLDPIPVEIGMICMSYYFVEEDEFAEVGANNELSENGKVVTKIAPGWGSCNHGKIIIESTANCICRWDLKIRALTSGGMKLGIISDAIQRDYLYPIPEGSFYIYWNSGETFNNDKSVAKYGWSWISCEQSYKQGDQVSIILDLIHGKVTFLVNGTDAKNGYENIEIGDNIQYRLLAAMHFDGDCVEILNFERTYK